ncbi:MAG: DUF983 domain-containing protein [Anaerolineae bacterium]
MNETQVPWWRPVLRGTFLRCPNCGQGKMFDGLFSIRAKCEVCHVRYEREGGESIGGTMLLLVFAELFAVGGFFITVILLGAPILSTGLFWLAFNVLFILLGYRHTRGMWVGVVYLTGNVITDEEAEQRAQHTKSRWLP